MAQKNQNESTTHLDIGPVLEALFDCSVVDSTPLQNANTKDNTFSFQGDRYETPVDLRGKEVQLRYERHRQGKDSLRSLSHRIREFRVPMRAEADSRGIQPQSQWQNQVDLTDF